MDPTHFVLAAEVTPEHKPRVRLKQSQNFGRNQKSEKFGGPQKSESITGPQKSENIGHSLKSENPRTLRAENHLGLAEASEDASSLANPCSGNVPSKTSENLGPARTHPSENLELARAHPGESLSRTLSRGGLPSDNLSRGGLLSDNLSRGPGQFSDTLSRGSGQFCESRTLQFGPRQRLIIGADAIVREREVRKKSQKLLKIPFFYCDLAYLSFVVVRWPQLPGKPLATSR